LTELFILRGPPEYIRSDNCAEFIAQRVLAWIGASVPRPPLSNQDHPRKTAPANASMLGSEMSF
jgi:hypothetical protein